MLKQFIMLEVAVIMPDSLEGVGKPMLLLRRLMRKLCDFPKI
jgi:hypothetical protein